MKKKHIKLIFFIILTIIIIMFILLALNSSNNMIEVPNKKYSIDEKEVTIIEFEKCVSAKICQEKNYGIVVKNHTLCNFGENKKDFHPMNCRNYEGAKEYCKWMGKRLPTEEEWVYAAKGGEELDFSGSNNPNDVAFFGLHEEIGTAHTKFKKPNGYGIYDMSGNVWEWVDNKVIKGGSYDSSDFFIKINSRKEINSSEINPNIGFRCVKDY